MENRLPGWSPDGQTWYTHEGGEQVTYTTNESNCEKAVYVPTIEIDKPALCVLRTLQSSICGNCYLGQDKELELVAEAIRLIKDE